MRSKSPAFYAASSVGVAHEADARCLAHCGSCLTLLFVRIPTDGLCRPDLRLVSMVVGKMSILWAIGRASLGCVR